MPRPSTTQKIMARTGSFYSSCTMLFKAHVDESPLALKKAWDAPDPASSVKIHFSRSLKGRLTPSEPVFMAVHLLMNNSCKVFESDGPFIGQRSRLYAFSLNMMTHLSRAFRKKDSNPRRD